jgi:hypothetical protein
LPANNAGYTAVLRGKNNSTGIGLVVSTTWVSRPTRRQTSARGLVESGDNVLIGGIITSKG